MRLTTAVPWCATFRFELFIDWKVWLVGVNWGVGHCYFHLGPLLVGVYDRSPWSLK